jgi:ribose 5-phosphate isomerase A
MPMPGATSCTGGSSHSLGGVEDESARARAWAAAGEAAAARVEDGMAVGLGTGRAAAAGIRALARRVAGGLRCRGVPTSRASAALARELGIGVERLRSPLDIAFDGADAVDPGGLIVKGAGGALVRERLVARAAAIWLVLVDEPKLVVTLDEWGRLPVAAIPFGAARVAAELADLGPIRRPGRSDDGLTLLDLQVPAGSDWRAVAARAEALSGVVDHGLFHASLDRVLVGRPDGSCSPAG